MSSISIPIATAGEARELVRELYGLEVEAGDLPSSEDRNFLLEHASGRRLVLKVAHGAVTREELELQNGAMDHLAARGVSGVPRVCSTLDGERIATIERDGASWYVRLLTYLEGAPWSAGVPRPPAVARELGRFAGALDRALAGFCHPALRRDSKWDLKRVLDLRRYLREVPAGTRDRVERVFDRFEARVLPLWRGLRTGAIHGDVNNDNVLIDEGGSRVAGVIDFADVVKTATVSEVAIAMAYAMLGHDEPLAMGCELLGGYHEVSPLETAELDVLFDLILARLAMNLALLFHLDGRDPDNAYLTANRETAGRLLEELLEHDPQAIRERFAAACGESAGVVHKGRAIDEILAARRRHLGASLSIAYEKPLKIVRGAGPYLFDHRGRAYLDGVNNVNHVGHCHPKVVAAAHAQNAVLNTNTRYLHDLLVEYAERLTATLPEPLSVCYFVNSGSEANDLALRLARAYTGRRDAIVTGGAYHGTTICAVELSPYKFDGPGGAGRASWVHQVACPDVYRGPYKSSDPEAGSRYAAEVRRAIERAETGIAAFFCESMISCGGQVVPPPGYLRQAYAHVRAAGGVCVADEVQVGFGRPGEAFWAFETQDAVPDVVTLGKPIGNGHPLSAVVTTPEIARAFAGGMEYFNTFGGNPVSCAVGLAVLDVIEEEGLQENARRVGDHLLQGLGELAARHELIGDVRGRGLFLGVELVRDRETLEPAREEATAVIEAARDRGVLLSSEGPFHNVLKIKPPMVWTRAHGDILVETLDEVLA